MVQIHCISTCPATDFDIYGYRSVLILAGTSSAAGNPPPGSSAGGAGGAGVVQGVDDPYPRTSLQVLPFYYAIPIVPVPPGMEPLPRFRYTEAPRFPIPDAGTRQQRAWYLCSVGVDPGLKWMTWESFRPSIEAHRGYPTPHRPVFRRVDGPLPSTITDVRVLPPPHRPAVELEGAHFWAVYIGRVPGVYSSLYVIFNCVTFLWTEWLRGSRRDVRAQTEGIVGAVAEIFSSEEAAIRWFWYARARGFVERRVG